MPREKSKKLSILLKIARKIKLISSYFQAEAALMYDSVYAFAIGMQTLEQSHTLKMSNVSCDKEQPWDGGLSLINYINSVSVL